MWINKKYFNQIVADYARVQQAYADIRSDNVGLMASRHELNTQKAKDDLTIDWMRHRINALEKQNAILMQKVAGVAMPVPEIVASRPGTMSAPDFSHLPSFEDVGDSEAIRLGIGHDSNGFVEFRDDMKRATTNAA